MIKPSYITLDFSENDFPKILKEISDPPEALFARGSIDHFDRPAIAIVGTRKATQAGRSFAQMLASQFAKNNITVVSGLALGIDTAAHTGALDANGITVAVLGNGIHTVYPSQNHSLAQKIIERNGTIVSEYDETVTPQKYHFIQRNRIISGLSLAVVVIEAPARSGALATARFAAEQGRDVFVIPGSITHPNYAGSHALIRDGATLATSAEEILDDLGLHADREEKSEEHDLLLSPAEKRIYDTLKTAGNTLSIDIIIRETNLEPHIVSQAITLLTLKNAIKEMPSGYCI
jgi:DNA processing protein